MRLQSPPPLLPALSKSHFVYPLNSLPRIDCRPGIRAFAPSGTTLRMDPRDGPRAIGPSRGRGVGRSGSGAAGLPGPPPPEEADHQRPRAPPRRPDVPALRADSKRHRPPGAPPVPAKRDRGPESGFWAVSPSQSRRPGSGPGPLTDPAGLTAIRARARAESTGRFRTVGPRRQAAGRGQTAAAALETNPHGPGPGEGD